MKKVFSSRFLIAALAISGTLFTQTGCQPNGGEQHQQEKNREAALVLAKEEMQARFIERAEYGYIPNASSRKNLLTKYFTVNDFSQTEMDAIIDNSLKRNGVKEPYEYCITNHFNEPIISSQNFKEEYFAGSVKELICPPGGTYSETLFVYLEKENQ